MDVARSGEMGCAGLHGSKIHTKDWFPYACWEKERGEILFNTKIEIMFILKLQDRNGAELNIGDIVKVSNGKNFQFYCEVKYLEDEQSITPFHTFSFHSFEKVDKIPENAIKTDEERYGIWYVNSPETDPIEHKEKVSNYLIEWRALECLLSKGIYRIEKVKTIEQLKLF
jgi:hypothetical protein